MSGKEVKSFSIKSNFIINILFFSSGEHPNCKCDDERFQFDKKINACLECPVNKSEGLYPNCTCNNGLFSVNNGQCVECPENSTGLFPY